MKKLLIFVSGVLAVLIIIVLFRTVASKSKQVSVPASPSLTVPDSVLTHLQQAIRFKTVTNEDGKMDSSAFAAFHLFLQHTFPLIDQQLQKEIVSGYTLLFHWKGKNASAKPIILMAHQDVVPVEESSIHLWKADPFSGELKDGYVWGRGTEDDKGSLMALLEGIEKLLKEGFQPFCDVYIALGHDEEANIQSGANRIVTLLQKRQIKPAFVLDEGGEITANEIPGIASPVAVVGIAEKGYVTLELKIIIPGGHSSMPKKETSIDQLAKAVIKLEENPFPADFNVTVNSFMDYIGPEMPFSQRLAFANRWLFSPLIKRIYSDKASGDAMIRTTTAPTIFQSGVKENVIPSVATAIINFRTLPGTSTDDVIAHTKKVINDKRISITVRDGGDTPDIVADVEDVSFRYLQRTIRSWRNDVLVTPYLVLGRTDGRYFTALTKQVYRFIPFNDFKGFHGVNEKVGADEFKQAVLFYYFLVKGYNGQ